MVCAAATIRMRRRADAVGNADRLHSHQSAGRGAVGIRDYMAGKLA